MFTNCGGCYYHPIKNYKEGTEVVALSRKPAYKHDNGNNLTNYLMQVRQKKCIREGEYNQVTETDES